MLEVEDLTCLRKDRALFSELSFSVRKGEILQVVGPNGSGKTTLIRTLVGLYTNFRGEINWNLSAPPLFMGHRRGINDQMTVRENVEWLVSLNDQVFKPSQFTDVMKNLGLAESESVLCSDLSFGQKKKVSIAPFLLSDNLCWLMDEPFSGLDKNGVTLLGKLFGDRMVEGGVIIFSSHQPVSIGGPLRSVVLS